MSYVIIKFDKSGNRPHFEMEPIDNTSPLWDNRDKVVFVEVHAGYMICRIEESVAAKRIILAKCKEVAHGERLQLEQDAHKLGIFENACVNMIDTMKGN